MFVLFWFNLFSSVIQEVRHLIYLCASHIAESVVLPLLDLLKTLCECHLIHTEYTRTVRFSAIQPDTEVYLKCVGGLIP